MIFILSHKIASEMQRIVGKSDLISTAKIKWDGVKEKILQQASLEGAHKIRLRNKLKEIDKSGMLYNLLSFMITYTIIIFF